jgi:hypothetical protein
VVLPLMRLSAACAASVAEPEIWLLIASDNAEVSVALSSSRPYAHEDMV